MKITLPKTSKATPPKKDDVERLRKALLSIGVNKKSAETLLRSKTLDRIVVPIYWKDGLVSKAQTSWLQKLPDFLKSFEKEFPDGEIRWDPDYDEENEGVSSDVAIHIFFDYQEDDQGDHWSPRPTPEDEESYRKMLKKYSYIGPKPVQAQTVLHGR